MDITNQNFISRLPEICETVQNCDFIAIDTELSGLLRDRTLNRFDSPEERFNKALSSSRGYFIMQFGLSCFSRVDNLRYSNRTYNFYIFPQPHKCFGDINRTFSLQAHAIQFLTEHNFDFNKLFKYGVSYLTFEEKKLLSAQLKIEKKSRTQVEMFDDGVPKFVPNGMLPFCRVQIKKVTKFIKTQKKNFLDGDKCDMSICPHDNEDREMRNACDMSEQNEVPKKGPSMEIRDCGSNHRRSVLKKALECIPDADYMEVETHVDPDSNENYLVVEFVDKETKTERHKNALVAAKGFLEIIETMILNKKPIVGHNLLLDLVQIINQFIEELSDDYCSFKETCNSLFPLIYDTKYIAHSVLYPKLLAQNQSRLNDLYCHLRDSKYNYPKIQIDHSGVFYNENQLPHQAGYDAYMSGFCFVVLCQEYLGKGNMSCGLGDIGDGKSIARLDEIVREFSNKVYLSYSYDYKCYDLVNHETEPDRSHVFYVEFPNSWSLEDLFQKFHQLGGVDASRLDQKSALCALRDIKQLEATREKANQLKDSKAAYRIYSYDAYLESYKSGSGRATKMHKGIPGVDL